MKNYFAPPLFHLGKIPVSLGRILAWIIIIAGLFANYYIWRDIAKKRPPVGGRITQIVPNFCGSAVGDGFAGGASSGGVSRSMWLSQNSTVFSIRNSP